MIEFLAGGVIGFLLGALLVTVTHYFEVRAMRDEVEQGDVELWAEYRRRRHLPEDGSEDNIWWGPPAIVDIGQEDL